MQTKLAMFEYLKLQAFIMHFCMIQLRKYIRTLVITRNSQHYHVNIVHSLDVFHSSETLPAPFLIHDVSPGL